jgi:hypothetical protein
MASAERLVSAADVTLTIFPNALTLDGETPERTDPAGGELAGLMHDRLIGTLRVERGADARDWHALLLLLARPPEELLDEGGVAKAWAATGRTHFDIHEIDYAEVLRERLGGDAAAEAQWATVPDALGDDPNSVSHEFEESDLGGMTFRLKVVVGR